MGSAHTSPRVLWGDWGEGVVTMDLRIGVFDLQLVETKVLTLHSSPPLPGGFTVEMYDLSRSGQKDVRAQRVSEGEVGRTTRRILTPKWSHLFQLGDIASNNIFLVGNKVACFHVRPFRTIREIFDLTSHRADHSMM